MKDLELIYPLPVDLTIPVPTNFEWARKQSDFVSMIAGEYEPTPDGRLIRNSWTGVVKVVPSQEIIASLHAYDSHTGYRKEREFCIAEPFQFSLAKQGDTLCLQSKEGHTLNITHSHSSFETFQDLGTPYRSRPGKIVEFPDSQNPISKAAAEERVPPAPIIYFRPPMIRRWRP